MKTYHISVLAKIKKHLFVDDQETFDSIEWSAEFECNETDLDKLLDLNVERNIETYNIPDCVKFRIQNCNELQFDELKDKIETLFTLCIRELVA